MAIDKNFYNCSFYKQPYTISLMILQQAQTISREAQGSLSTVLIAQRSN